MHVDTANGLERPLMQHPDHSPAMQNYQRARRASALLLGSFALTATTLLCELRRWSEPTAISTSFAPDDSSISRKLRLRIDGVSHTYTVAALNSTPADVFTVSDDTLSLGHGPAKPSVGTRLWVAHDASLQPYSYAKFRLLGKSLSYRVDLSHVPCSCNAALYWVSLPGYTVDDEPAPGAFGNYCPSHAPR